VWNQVSPAKKDWTWTTEWLVDAGEARYEVQEQVQEQMCRRAGQNPEVGTRLSPFRGTS
jgi:hypothetical protein